MRQRDDVSPFCRAASPAFRPCPGLYGRLAPSFPGRRIQASCGRRRYGFWSSFRQLKPIWGARGLICAAGKNSAPGAR